MKNEDGLNIKDKFAYKKGTQHVEGDEVREGQHAAARAAADVLALVLVVAVALDLRLRRHGHHDVLPRFTCITINNTFYTKEL